ncbi:hypothetical protein QFC19_008154 [Naganishia cerealis]|uniref:Uncharacterized protein n=1 Tax=Naganishia cerealis TaxID=610337 RepID=A0ACC2V4G3_9TREE|nr:hypothetical protein QFC19_008154 [Naganishia cerealis]
MAYSTTHSVLNEKRRPIGYLDIKLLKRKFEQGVADPNDPIRKHTTLFRPFHPSSSGQDTSSSSESTEAYEIIHPLTPLEDLERFFDRQALAAEARNVKRHEQVARRRDKETTPTPSSSTNSTGAGGVSSGAEGEEGQWDDEAEGTGHEFALVTDLGRKWVLAVATRNDLEVSNHAGGVELRVRQDIDGLALHPHLQTFVKRRGQF